MIDLHLHTTASDGVLTPSELVEMAVERGMEAIAITDHDTIDGIVEGRERANKLGIDFVAGVELSSQWKGREVHILGYFLDIEDSVLLGELEELKKARDERNTRILEKLEKVGIYIGIDEVVEEAGGNIISRAHMANIIIRKGYAKDKKEVFQDLLGIDGIAYEPKGDLSPERAVEIIVKNGGIASLAHPKYISNNPDIVRDLGSKLKLAGLEAIEVYYSNMYIRDVLKFKKLAKSMKLVATGGSDYHGSNKALIEIGDGNVPYSVYKELKALKSNRK